jgi:hypothetical protein
MRAIAQVHRVPAPGGRLACLTSPGELADVFRSREGSESLLTRSAFGEVKIETCYDVLRVATARSK